MKTLRPNNMHQFIYGFSIDIKQEPQWDNPLWLLYKIIDIKINRAL